MEVRREPLSIKEKLGYGLGDGGCNIIFGAMTLFVTYFYTDVYGLSASLVGILLLSTRILDGVSDLLMGAIADRTRSRWGRFRPWILWMAVPFAASSVPMFTTPDLSYTGKVIYAFVSYSLPCLMYTALNIPYCSLGVVITNDPGERVALQSYRFVMVSAGTLLLTTLLLPMAGWFGGEDRQRGYQLSMLVLAAITVAMFLFCFASVRERVQPTSAEPSSIKADLKDILKNDQWLAVLALTLCNVFPGFVRMAVTLYYVTWVMRQSPGFATFFISLGAVCMMLVWCIKNKTHILIVQAREDSVFRHRSQL